MYIKNLSENQVKGTGYNTQNNIEKDQTIEIIEANKKILRQDILSISSEAQALFNQFNPMDLLENQALDKEDSSDDLIKCIKIATRIMSGHNVPLKDERFLAEKQPDMYLRAILLRRERKDAKDYKSLLKDEEEDLDQVADQDISLDTIPIEEGAEDV